MPEARAEMVRRISEESADAQAYVKELEGEPLTPDVASALMLFGAFTAGRVEGTAQTLNGVRDPNVKGVSADCD